MRVNEIAFTPDAGECRAKARPRTSVIHRFDDLERCVVAFASLFASHDIHYCLSRSRPVYYIRMSPMFAILSLPGGAFNLNVAVEFHTPIIAPTKIIIKIIDRIRNIYITLNFYNTLL